MFDPGSARRAMDMTVSLCCHKADQTFGGVSGYLKCVSCIVVAMGSWPVKTTKSI
jgi:hypothetical protein